MTYDDRVNYEPANLVERVKNSINKNGYTELKHIQCDAQRSNIHLKGCLTSYYLKQVAQTIAIKVPGVRQVVNDIEVKFPSTTESLTRQC